MWSLSFSDTEAAGASVTPNVTHLCLCQGDYAFGRSPSGSAVKEFKQIPIFEKKLYISRLVCFIRIALVKDKSDDQRINTQLTVERASATAQLALNGSYTALKPGLPVAAHDGDILAFGPAEQHADVKLTITPFHLFVSRFHFETAIYKDQLDTLERSYGITSTSEWEPTVTHVITEELSTAAPGVLDAILAGRQGDERVGTKSHARAVQFVKPEWLKYVASLSGHMITKEAHESLFGEDKYQPVDLTQSPSTPTTTNTTSSATAATDVRLPVYPLAVDEQPRVARLHGYTFVFVGAPCSDIALTLVRHNVDVIGIGMTDTVVAAERKLSASVHKPATTAQSASSEHDDIGNDSPSTDATERTQPWGVEPVSMNDTVAKVGAAAEAPRRVLFSNSSTDLSAVAAVIHARRGEWDRKNKKTSKQSSTTSTPIPGVIVYHGANSLSALASEPLAALRKYGFHELSLASLLNVIASQNGSLDVAIAAAQKSHRNRTASVESLPTTTKQTPPRSNAKRSPRNSVARDADVVDVVPATIQKGKYEFATTNLDDRWIPRGRPVPEPTLSATSSSSAIQDTDKKAASTSQAHPHSANDTLAVRNSRGRTKAELNEAMLADFIRNDDENTSAPGIAEVAQVLFDVPLITVPSVHDTTVKVNGSVGNVVNFKRFRKVPPITYVSADSAAAVHLADMTKSIGLLGSAEAAALVAEDAIQEREEDSSLHFTTEQAISAGNRGAAKRAPASLVSSPAKAKSTATAGAKKTTRASPKRAKQAVAAEVSEEVVEVVHQTAKTEKPTQTSSGASGKEIAAPKDTRAGTQQSMLTPWSFSNPSATSTANTIVTSNRRGHSTAPSATLLHMQLPIPK